MKVEKQFDTFAEAQDWARGLAKKGIKHSVKSASPYFVVSYIEKAFDENLEHTQLQPNKADANPPEKEKIFLHKNGVVVTSARLSVAGRSFKIDDIVEVEVGRVDYKLIPLLFLMGGVFLVYTIGLVAIIFPASILFLLAALSSIVDLSIPRVEITTTNGKNTVVLSSNDKQWVDLVAGAIRRAIRVRTFLNREGT